MAILQLLSDGKVKSNDELSNLLGITNYKLMSNLRKMKSLDLIIIVGDLGNSNEILNVKITQLAQERFVTVCSLLTEFFENTSNFQTYVKAVTEE